MTPQDTANRYWIAIEADNNGLGEEWPSAQRTSYARGCAALIRGLERDRGIVLDPLRDVVAHFEWAPTRKIDPAGPPTPFAVMMDRYKRWDMAAFRRSVAWHLDKMGDDMKFRFYDSGGRHYYDSRLSGGSPLEAGVPRTIQAPRAPDGSVPAGVMLTVTAVAPAAAGWMAAYPDAHDGSSCVNFAASQVIANTTSTRVASDGTFKILSSAAAHLVVDIVGVYLA